MNAIKKAIRGLTMAELVASALFFAIMVLSYFISVVNRNFIKGSMPWTEELALYSMVYLSLIGTELGLRDGTQVSVTAITSKLEGKLAGTILWYISRIVLIAFVVLIFRQGWALVAKQMAMGQTTPVMKVPMWIMYASLVVSFGLTIITQIMILIGRIFRIPMDEITNVDGIINIFNKKKEG